jgi:hypothetical protein
MKMATRRRTAKPPKSDARVTVTEDMDSLSLRRVAVRVGATEELGDGLGELVRVSVGLGELFRVRVGLGELVWVPVGLGELVRVPVGLLAGVGVRETHVGTIKDVSFLITQP